MRYFHQEYERVKLQFEKQKLVKRTGVDGEESYPLSTRTDSGDNSASLPVKTFTQDKDRIR